MQLLLVVFSVLMLLLSCGGSGEASPIVRKNDSLETKKEVVIPQFPVVKYKKVWMRTNSTRDSIIKSFSRDTNIKTATRAIATLNRKELRFIRKGDTIIVPESFVDDLRTYSIFPTYYPEAALIPKIIIVSNAYQCYACYEYGILVRFAAANTGKESTQTYPGRYSLVYRKLVSKSSIDSNWILPFTWSFHPQAGNAFHQFDMPGRPVSHSCVRQFETDANWLYKWGEGYKRGPDKKMMRLSGTPVIIIDVFDFRRKRGGPWKELRDNQEVKLKLPAKPLEVDEALIPICQIPKESRGGLKNYQRYVNAEDTLRARGVIRSGVKLVETVNFNKVRREKAEKKAKHERLKNQNSSIPASTKASGIE